MSATKYTCLSQMTGLLLPKSASLSACCFSREAVKQQRGWFDVISEEQLQEKIMKRLDLSKEIEDDELTGLIFRVLAEESEMEYIPLQKKVSLGRELFNVFRKLDVLQDFIEDLRRKKK